MANEPLAAGDGRADLVRAAVALVGERGQAATTVRAVAERAGVSAPLVMHHFGSKDGLLAAADEQVTSVLREAMQAIATSDSEATLQALLAVPEAAEALAYIGRSLLNGGRAGEWWFSEMIAMTLDGLDRAVAAGLARPSDDPQMRALLLIAMDLGLVLMRPLVERELGTDLADPRIVERWVRTEFDILRHGVLADAGTAAADTEDVRS